MPQDGARGGRDLRLHVGGDVRNAEGAAELSAAVKRFYDRGGGAAWTYTHSWRGISRDAWGQVSVLASVETAADQAAARARGYASAIVVERFPNGRRVFHLPGSSARFVSCPAEVSRVTCVECRLCLNDGRLLDRGLAIAFSVHGTAADKARSTLRVLNDSSGVQLGLFEQRGG